MNFKIDWLSFVIDAPTWPVVPFGQLRGAAYATVGEWAGEWWPSIHDNQQWSLEGGRAPFNLSIMRADGGARLFFSSSLPLMLLEVTGVGCTRWMKTSDIFAACVEFKEFVSRIDVACDFETEVSPAEFAVKRSVERFKAHGEVVSPTGSTYYVGSLKSERFARVYRYNEPHPRAHLLRVEHVFRKESARLAIGFLEGHTQEEWISAIGKVYGWEHDLWRTNQMVGKLESRVVERPEVGKTVFWMFNTVAPCMARLLDEGKISYQEFEAAVAKHWQSLVDKRGPTVSEEGQDND